MSEGDNAQKKIFKGRFAAVPLSIRLCYRKEIEILSSYEVELEEFFRSIKKKKRCRLGWTETRAHVQEEFYPFFRSCILIP